MKKNILILLLSAVLLTGCEFDATLQQFFNKNNDEDKTQQNNAENTENSQEKPLNSSENQNNEVEKPTDTNPQESEEEKPSLENEFTVTIKTSGQEFLSYATKAGVQTEDGDNAEKLTKYFEDNLAKQNLLTSISFTKLNTAVWNDVVYLCIGTGYYAHIDGNKFAEGNLTWNSGEKIYKVEIKALAYAKKDNNYLGIDKISHVWIDEDDHSLETESEPELQTFSKTYEEGVNSFSIKSTGSRVNLESITITWKK